MKFRDEAVAAAAAALSDAFSESSRSGRSSWIEYLRLTGAPSAPGRAGPFATLDGGRKSKAST
jgi:hypothetical protein